MSVLVVVHEIRELDEEMLISSGEDGVVGPRATGSVGKVALKKHIERTSCLADPEATAVFENSVAGKVFLAEKGVKGLKGKEKMRETGMGLTDLSCKKGEAQFEWAKMVDWAIEELLEEGELGGLGSVRFKACGVERRASLENSFNQPEGNKRAHGRPSRSFLTPP